VVKDRDQLGYLAPRILSLRAQAQSKLDRQILKHKEKLKEGRNEGGIKHAQLAEE